MNAPLRAESTALTTAGDPPDYNVPAMASPGSTALILDPRHMANMMAVAEVMATGMSTVPQHLRKNKGDCLAVVMQSAQWGMNPFAVAQKTHVVNGALGYEAQLVNAVVNTMAPTKDRINYEWFGDWSAVMGKFEERESKKKVDEDTGKPLKYRVPAWNIKDEAGLGIKVWATMKGENQPRVLELLLVQCRTRNSPLWADDPRQQIAYLAVKRWTRLHCPDVLLGVYTPDELEERQPKNMGAADVVEPDIPATLIKAAEAAAKAGLTAYQKFWKDTGPDNRKLLASRHDSFKDRATSVDKGRTVDAPPADPAPAEPAKPDLKTRAGVQAAMDAAANEDALNIAADWGNELPDEADRKAVAAHYDALLPKFRGA